MRNLFISIGVVIGIAGCSSSPQAPLPERSGRALQDVEETTVPSADPTDSVGAGYVHQPAKSRFSIGAGIIEKQEHGMQKIVGDQGVFAALPTGKVLALANYDAVVRSHPGPLAGGSAAHNKAVRDYFVSGGLPEAQIASVDIMPAMMGMADTAKQITHAPQLVCYFSMVRRQIGGVAVPDSYAWARINVDGAVVEESVYWPDIPSTVVMDAVAFAGKLSIDSAEQEFVASLPRRKKGHLAIHHTPGEWTQGFTAAAVYDVADDNVGFGATIHYDSASKKLVLPHEGVGAWGPPPEKRPKVRSLP